MSTPFPVSGVVYDTDGATALANVRVDIRNSTQNTSLAKVTNANGQYLGDLANLTSSYADGDSISIFVSYGRYYDEEIFTVDLTEGSKEQDMTLETLLPTAAQYCSATDVRNYTNIAAAEYSDKQLSDMINRITDQIDLETGRTWKGAQTVTDEEYDGNGTLMLALNQTDIQSITALSIDDDANGTYTSLTVADDVFRYREGYIILNNINSPITNFTPGFKTVKVSYTYGNTAPSESVRRLCVLMVSNEIHLEQPRTEEIKKLMNYLSRRAWPVPI